MRSKLMIMCTPKNQSEMIPRCFRMVSPHLRILEYPARLVLRTWLLILAMTPGSCVKANPVMAVQQMALLVTCDHITNQKKKEEPKVRRCK